MGEKIQELIFSINHGGLGDRFCMLSNILHTMQHSPAGSVKLKAYLYPQDEADKKLRNNLKFNNLFEVIDFLHLERPNDPFLEDSVELLNEHSDHFEGFMKNVENEMYRSFNDTLLRDAKYWPVRYEKFAKKKYITYLLYHTEKLHFGQSHKILTIEQIDAFKNLISNMTELSDRLEFVELEDYNYAKNIELLSKSYFHIGSEGMWTHLSRAMNVYTIAYSLLDEFIGEFNQQGHFCSKEFLECLEKMKEKSRELL